MASIPNYDYYPGYSQGRLAPEVAAFLASLGGGDERPLEALTPAEVRLANHLGAWARPRHPGVRTEDHSLAVPGGTVMVRLYRPSAAAAAPGAPGLPLLLWLHGGGWVFGSVGEADGLCSALAAKAACLVASVDYRLSPEHPFPQPLEDAGAALAWAFTSAKDLGVDPRRIAVGGESAGANMAAALGLRALDGQGPMPAFLLLLCPWLDLAHFDTPSYEAFGEGPWLPRSNLEWYRAQYLGGADPARPLVSPALAPSLAGLPPTHVVTAEFDPLRDEGEAFAQSLRAAGVRASLVRYPGMIHSFMVLGGRLAAAETCLDDCAAQLAKELWTP